MLDLSISKILYLVATMVFAVVLAGMFHYKKAYQTEHDSLVAFKAAYDVVAAQVVEDVKIKEKEKENVAEQIGTAYTSQAATINSYYERLRKRDTLRQDPMRPNTSATSYINDPGLECTSSREFEKRAALDAQKIQGLQEYINNVCH